MNNFLKKANDMVSHTLPQRAARFCLRNKILGNRPRRPRRALPLRPRASTRAPTKLSRRLTRCASGAVRVRAQFSFCFRVSAQASEEFAVSVRRFCRRLWSQRAPFGCCFCCFVVFVFCIFLCSTPSSKTSKPKRPTKSKPRNSCAACAMNNFLASCCLFFCCARFTALF